jgi:glycosyltransferase involved in cell wall biosynthesis
VDGTEKDLGKVYAVLATYHRPQALSLMLERVAEQSIVELLFIVDNAPSPATEKVVHNHGAKLLIEYVRAPENLGPSGAMAMGMSRILDIAADDDWVVLLDDDDPPPNASTLADLRRFGSRMRARDFRTAGVGLGGARFDLRKARGTQIRDEERGGPVLVDYLGGNRFPVYLIGAIREVGVFRPDLFFSFEELEYGLRLRRAGYSLYVNGPLSLQVRAQLQWRYGAPGSRTHPAVRLDEPTWRRYYSLRNLLFILRSYHQSIAILRVVVVRAIGKPVLNLPLTPRRSLRHLSINARACWDAMRGRMGKTIDPVI